jgi:hypothetical protein
MGQSVDSHRSTQTKTCSRLAGLGPRTTGWLIAIPLLILFGHAVPSIVQQRIPWQFQSNWLTLRATGDTPSAAVRTALGLAQSNPRGSVRTASPSVDSELQALRQRIADRNLPVLVSDVLSASSPGSVVADLGNERTTGSGAIVPPDQVGFCLIREGDDWVIASVSPKGTTC